MYRMVGVCVRVSWKRRDRGSNHSPCRRISSGRGRTRRSKFRPWGIATWLLHIVFTHRKSQPPRQFIGDKGAWTQRHWVNSDEPPAFGPFLHPAGSARPFVYTGVLLGVPLGSTRRPADRVRGGTGSSATKCATRQTQDLAAAVYTDGAAETDRVGRNEGVHAGGAGRSVRSRPYLFATGRGAPKWLWRHHRCTPQQRLTGSCSRSSRKARPVSCARRPLGRGWPGQDASRARKQGLPWRFRDQENLLGACRQPRPRCSPRHRRGREPGHTGASRSGAGHAGSPNLVRVALRARPSIVDDGTSGNNPSGRLTCVPGTDL